MSTSPSDTPLENALRSLPPVNGHDNWEALEKQLQALRPHHVRRRRVRRVQFIASMMGVLVLVAVSALWMTQRTPQVAEIDDLNEWVRAHQETKSVQSQTWDDPWVAVASESTP